jgi:hypothetical protein
VTDVTGEGSFAIGLEDLRKNFRANPAPIASALSLSRWSSLGLLLEALFGIVARADNLNVRADMNGCESIVTESGRRDRSEAQRRKNEACNIELDCDLDRQQRTIEKYKEAKDRLDKGDVNDSDKDKLKDTVRALKDDLDQRKERARRNTGWVRL